MSTLLLQKLMKAKTEGTGLQIDNREVDGMLRLITDDGFSQRKNLVLKSASAGLADAWSAALFDYNTEYELWIIICVFGWLTVHFFAKRFAKRVGPPLIDRPTFIANNIHCITTSCMAAFLLAQDKESRDYNLWQRWTVCAGIEPLPAHLLPAIPLSATLDHLGSCRFPFHTSLRTGSGTASQSGTCSSRCTIAP